MDDLMASPPLLALATAGVILALADWVAVGTEWRSFRAITKPAPMIALIALAMMLDPADSTIRGALVVGLVLSLAGDILLLPGGDRCS